MSVNPSPQDMYKTAKILYTNNLHTIINPGGQKPEVITAVGALLGGLSQFAFAADRFEGGPRAEALKPRG